MSDCLKLTVYFGERARAGRHLLADALLDLFARHDVETSVLLRGVEGFGLQKRLRAERIEVLSYDLPLVALAVDVPDRIEALAPDAAELVASGLVTLERGRIVTAAALPDGLGPEVKLTVVLGRGERAAGRAAYLALVDLLHRQGLHGATVLLGVDGTALGERERGRFFSRNARVPLLVVSVGPAAAVAAVLPALRGLLPRAPATLERARVCKRDGRRLAEPPTLPARDDSGLEIWQKVTVYASEAATHEGRSLHARLVEGLRREGLAGVTSLRGVWGFSGDHPPHGDSLRSLRRRVPVVTVCVDTPARIRAAWPLLDELTAEAGLVTAERVPALRAAAGASAVGGLRLARPG